MNRHVLLTEEEITLLKHLGERYHLPDLNQIVERATKPNTERENQYIQSAKNQFHEEGVIEVDDAALVSDTFDDAPGAYVMAWVWVDKA